MLTQPRNYLISNVELNWARLDTPTNPFGVEIYELQIATESTEVADEWASNWLNVKERDGKFTVSLKRNAKKRDGSDNGKVRVVDGDKAPLDGMIGNGSEGNVIVWQYPYENAGRKGVSGSLTAVQVTNHVKYEPGMDFDVVSSDSGEETKEPELF